MQPSKEVGYKHPRQKWQRMQRLGGREGPGVWEKQEAGVAEVE